MKKSSLKETRVQHETDNLQMKIYRNYSDVYCHWHDEYEFILALRGSCEVISDATSYTLNEGELALVGGGQIHQINITPPSQTAAVVIHPHLCGTDCMGYFSNSIVFDPVFKPSDPVGGKVIRNITGLIKVMENKNIGYELRVKSIVTDTFALLLENGSYGCTHSKTVNSVMEELVSLIHSEYRGSIDLDMLSHRSNYSKPYIIRLFKRHTGKTPVEYINSYRISKSLGLLSNTDMSVLDVGLEVGFENTAYFIKLFKAQMGVTPLRWRNSTK